MSQLTRSDTLPPPAYSERELDAKIASALEASLHVAQPNKQRAGDDEEWEEWDESAFEAAATHQQQQPRDRASSSSTAKTSSSPRALPYPSPDRTNPSSPTIRPLNIHKKSRSASSSNSGGSSEKQRPSWYADAGLQSGASSSSSSGPSQQMAPPSFVVQNVAESDDDNDETAPPPFTAVGPSLDGPPFEQVEPPYSIRQTPQPAPSPRPPSVYSSPNVLRPPPSPPSPPRRPASYSEPVSSPSQRMSFNSSMAYNKTGDSPRVHNVHQIQSLDAMSLYNSSVAAHLVASSPPQRPQSYISPQRPTSLMPQSSYKRESWIPAPVSPVPTYPHVRPHSHYASSTNVSESLRPMQNQGRWANSEQELSNFFR